MTRVAQSSIQVEKPEPAATLGVKCTYCSEPATQHATVERPVWKGKNLAKPAKTATMCPHHADWMRDQWTEYDRKVAHDRAARAARKGTRAR